MPVSYNFKKGLDIPSWLWLRQFPGGNSNPGTSNQYDGTRFIYWLIQTGTTATTASTTLLYRYDTWCNGWQFLATATSGNQGMDLEYDPQRNVLYILTGGALTSWQVFNLNTTSVTIAGVACAAWSLTTMAPVLTTAASIGASFTQPTWQSVPGAVDPTTGVSPTPGNQGSGVVAAGATTTTLTSSTDFFMPGMVGLEVTFDLTTATVALQGKRYLISAWTSSRSVTVTTTMAAVPATGDTYVLSLPTTTITVGSVQSTTTLQDTGVVWTTNFYSNSDVIIISGTGAGQRRRIASNTANTLTLTGAVTGNANTGPWTTTPDTTSVYQIQPSSDFLYYQVGTANTLFYKIDLSQSTGATWTALTAVFGVVNGGGNTFYPQSTAPFYIACFRGNGTTSFGYYGIGVNTWTGVTIFAGAETFSTGSSSCLLHGRKKLLITKESSQRNYILDLTTNILEPFPMSMYAVPTANDGKRVRYVKTADGIEWVYQMRAGGQELWRIPLEWL